MKPRKPSRHARQLARIQTKLDELAELLSSDASRLYVLQLLISGVIDHKNDEAVAGVLGISIARMEKMEAGDVPALRQEVRDAVTAWNAADKMGDDDGL